MDVLGGAFVLDADGAGAGTAPARYELGLDDVPGDRYPLATAAAATTSTIAGAVNANLPVDFGEVAGNQPNIVVAIGDLGDPAASTSLSGPDVAALLTGLSLANILPSFAMGFGQLFGELAAALDSVVFGRSLPIVGTGMGTQFDVFRQIREKVVGNVGVLTEFTPTLIEQALRDALGGSATTGLGWLDGDVTRISETQHELVFKLTLDVPTKEFDLQTDLNLPGLGLQLMTPGATTIAASRVQFDVKPFSMTLGISAQDGVFIDVSQSKELDVDLRAKLPQKADATIRSLPYRAEDTTTDPGVYDLVGNYVVNLTDGAGNNRLMWSELKLGDRAELIKASFSGDAHIDLKLQTALPQVILENAGERKADGTLASATYGHGASPTFQYVLDVDWAFQDTDPDIGDSTPTVVLRDVQFDLKRFLKDFLLPAVRKHGQALAPFEKILDFMNWRIGGDAAKDLRWPLSATWVDLVILLEGVNQTATFAQSAQEMRELDTWISRLEAVDANSLWIDIGDYVLDGQVARGKSSGKLLVDQQPNANEYQPADAGDPKDVSEYVDAIRRDLADGGRNTIVSQIYHQLPDGVDIGPFQFDTTAFNDVSNDNERAAFLFWKTLYLPGSSQLGGIPGYYDRPLAPIKYLLLEDPCNSVQLLLGLNKDGNPLKDTKPEEPEDLLRYEAPSLELSVPRGNIPGAEDLFCSFVKPFLDVADDFTSGKANSDEWEDEQKKKEKRAGLAYGWVFSVDVRASLGWGIDTSGLREFLVSGDAKQIADGFFFDETQGIGGALTLPGSPEIDLGSFSGSKDEDQVVIEIGVGYEAKLEFSYEYGKVGASFSAGANVTILVGAAFNLFNRDPDGSLRLRGSDFDLQRTKDDWNTYNLGGRADVKAELFCDLTAKLGPLNVTLVGVDLVILDLVLFDFNWPKNLIWRPKLTQPGSLIVNVGPNAPARGPDQVDGDETVHIGFDATTNEILVSAFGVDERVPAADVDRIVIDAGEGDDSIFVTEDVRIPVEIWGGPGSDQIYAGGGNAVIDGGEGDDYLVGGLGNDRIFGGPGNDVLLGGAGDDELDGGTGCDTLQGDEGDDVLFGGADDDDMLGGAGDDELHGGAGADDLRRRGGQRCALRRRRR